MYYLCKRIGQKTEINIQISISKIQNVQKFKLNN